MKDVDEGGKTVSITDSTVTYAFDDDQLTSEGGSKLYAWEFARSWVIRMRLWCHRMGKEQHYEWVHGEWINGDVDVGYGCASVMKRR